MRLRYLVTRILSGKPKVAHLWAEDAHFKALMRELRGFTLVDQVRCFMLYQYAEHVAHVPGDVAEVGVYKGGTARLLAKVVEPQGKRVHLFDTFSGMPISDPKKDLHRAGDFGDVSLERVKRYLRDCPNVRFYPGVFPLTGRPVEHLAFSLVHVDADIYQSVLDCCAFFYPRLQGGV